MTTDGFRQRVIACTSPLFILSACVAVPANVGFPSADPLPPSGGSIAGGAFVGGGTPFFYAGGGVSGAVDAHGTGVDFTLWGGGTFRLGLVGGHVEVALPLGKQPRAEAISRGDLPESDEPEGNRLHLLLGAGAGALIGSNLQFCRECEPPTETEAWIAPQGTVGISGSPSRGRSGFFWGARLGFGGSIFVPGRTTRERGYYEAATFAINMSSGLGWRWLVGEMTYLDLQAAPYFVLESANIHQSGYGFGLGGGAQLALCLGSLL